MKVDTALSRITGTLPEAEDRPGQRSMAMAVARVLERGGTLLVEAGTGTGKSLGYLVPSLVSSRRPIVVATATKALQDQLMGKDIPSVAAGLGRPVKAVALKGRSSYLCRAKEAEARQRLLADGEGGELTRLLEWAAVTETGDRAELDPAPSPLLWNELSVGGEECPGARRCSSGSTCLSEAARRAAEEADVVVVNHALLAISLVISDEGGNGLLPPPEAIIIDEAHRLEDALASALGIDLGQGRFRYAAGVARGLLTDRDRADELEEAARSFFSDLAGRAGSRIDDSVRHGVAAGAVRLAQAIASLATRVRQVPERGEERKVRLQRVLTALASDLQAALDDDRDDLVSWVEADRGAGRLRAAPLEVAGLTGELLFAASGEVPVVLTSATLTVAGSFAHLRSRLGVSEARELTVGSPFHYPSQGLLYVPRQLPDPRDPAFDAAARQEIARLLQASGGRAFCLFTSWRAMEAAWTEVGASLPWTTLRQGDAGPARLVARFMDEAPAVLFATVSFWQGVDVPGDALRLVILDKLPFSSPGDPLAAARVDAVREAGGDWFGHEVLPRAGLLLAQGVGRLIRRRTDRGVVAVLDRRLATAGYRRALLDTLPPLRRTVAFDDVAAFFHDPDTSASTVVSGEQEPAHYG